MREIEFKTYDNETGKVIGIVHVPLFMYANPDGTYGFKPHPRFTIMEYVGQKDIHGKKIYTCNILRQPMLTEFDSYLPGEIVEVFWCDGDLGYEVRDPSGKNIEHQSLHPEAEIVAVNYKEYLLKQSQ